MGFDKKFAIVLIAALSFLVAVQLAEMADSSDAADPTYIRSPSIKVFDHDSADYSDLAYLSDKLPTEFSAAEWIRDTDSGLWYNVNSASSDFGKVLRYGMMDDITLTEIRSDIGDWSPVFTSTSFVLVQVGCDISGDCQLGVEIKKDGTTVFTEAKAVSLNVAGCYVDGTVQGICLYTVDTTAGDITVADPAGLYSLALKCNGIAAGNATTDYRGTIYELHGAVKDKGGKSITGAVLTYQITDSEGTVMSEGSKVTGIDGKYMINSVKGTIVNITSISAAGFSFSTATYSYGTVTADVWPGFTFFANENYVKVNVKDQNSRPAQNVEISAEWYRSYANDHGKYTYERLTTGIWCAQATDADGTTLVTVSQIQAGYKLYIKGMTGQYSFVDHVNAIYPGDNFDTDLPVSLDTGNAYVNIASFGEVTIKADDYSAVITVNGNVDEYMAGGAALQGVEVRADWYYQAQNGSDYYNRTKNNIADGTFDVLTPGKAWFANPYSEEDGTVIVHYTKPTWSTATGEYAYLYVYAAGAPASSPSSEYAFNYILPADGAKSVTEYADGAVTCVAMEKDAVTAASVASDDVSYTLSGTISGDMPESVRVYCITPSGIEMAKNVVPSGSTITFSFTVKAGSSCKVGIDDLPGYTFTPQSQQMASAFADISFTSVSAATSWSIDRAVPTVLNTYTITNSTVGETITVKYSVAGTNVTTQVHGTGADISIPVKGEPGNIVSSFTVSGTGLYVKWMSDTQVRVSGMTQMVIVAYYNTDADQPDIGNTVGGQTIQILCEGESYGTVVTDTNGKASTTIPDIPEITYRVNDLSVEAVAIAGGAYDGCNGLNLKNVIPSPGSKQATVTIRYIATSSLQNEATPTNVDILTGPTMVTLTVGENYDYTAPEVEGFTFAGWYINGTSVSGTRDAHVCNLRVTEDMDGSTLVASYAAESPEPPKENWGTTIAIGILAVTIAIIAMIYVILQVRRY